MIAQKQWMEERLDVFRDAILQGNNEWCFIERSTIQIKLKEESDGLRRDERYVKALERMLAELSTPLAEGEVFAGRMVEGPCPDNTNLWESEQFFSHGHTTLDWPAVLNKGLLEIAGEAVEHAMGIGTPESRHFAQAAVRCCQAIDGFARRYAQAAAQEASAATNPEYHRQLLRMADALEHAPGRPARNFFEALQAIWLVQLTAGRCF